MEKRAVELRDSPASMGPPPASEAESLLAAVVYDVSLQVQSILENMLKMTGEIDQISHGITEEIEKRKESAAERKKALDEAKMSVLKAARGALDILGADN